MVQGAECVRWGADGPTLPLATGDGGRALRRADTVVDSGGFGVGDGECGSSGGWQHMRGRGRRNMAAPRRTGRRPPCAVPLWGADGGGGRVEAARLARPPLVRGVCCLPAATAGCWASMGGDGGKARCRRRRKYAGRHEGGEAMPAARSEGVLGVTCEGGAFVVFGGRDAGGGGCGVGAGLSGAGSGGADGSVLGGGAGGFPPTAAHKSPLTPQ